MIRVSWRKSDALLIVGALVSFTIAYASWNLSWSLSKVLLVLLIIGNIAPFVVGLLSFRFDPFEPQYAFLGYFFILSTLPSIYCLFFSYTLEPLLAVYDPTDSLRSRAVAAMVMGLSAFVIGHCLPLGEWCGILMPRPKIASTNRIRFLVPIGLALSGLAFSTLIISAGGLVAFLQNLSSWRTVGVMEGVGYLTFPTTVIAPAMALLYLLHTFKRKRKLRGWALAGLVCVCTLIPIIILGFRISLVPVLIQYAAAWHYCVKRLPIAYLGLSGLFGTIFLIGAGFIRETAAGANSPDTSALIKYLYRDSGLEAVERVIYHLDNGESVIGPTQSLAEAATIIVPRKLWPQKPQPVILAFIDRFFWEFFVNRGDPLNNPKSGISPTFIAEQLGMGGLGYVTVSALTLGFFARVLKEWRKSSEADLFVLFVYISIVSIFSIFAESPQSGLNALDALLILILLMWLFLCLRIKKPQSQRLP